MKKVVLVVITLMLVGCGPKQQAKLLISSFLDSNLKNTGIQSLHYSELDSTIYITDSAVMVMRANADTMVNFKHITYEPGKIGNKLIFIHVKYKLKDTPYSHTFYFDKDLKRVISFKND